MAEQMLQDWMDDVGLMPKPSQPEAPPLPLTWRKKQSGNRMVQAGYIGKTEVCHVFDSDYDKVTCWIVRLLPSFPGGPTEASTRNIYPTVEDAKDVAQQLYDRFLLECRLKAGAA